MELIRKNIDNLSDGENFRIGTGIINSGAETKEELEFIIFDILHEKEFNSANFSTTYGERKKLLEALKDGIDQFGIKNLSIVPIVYEGTDQSEIDKWLQYAVDNDWEGLMLNKDVPYKNKRTTDLIKLKRFYTMDLPVVGAVEGDGRLQGTLGALVVQFKDNTVNVGSGYSDSQRDKFWARRDSLIGKIIEVKYKEISRDKKTKLESLQYPRYLRFRDDKTDPSYD